MRCRALFHSTQHPRRPTLELTQLERRNHLGGPYDPGEFFVEVRECHRMDIFGRVFISIGTCPVEGPGRVTGQPSIETEIASHPRGCLNAMVRGSAADYDRSDAGGAKPRFQVSSNEGAVHSPHDDRFSRSLLGLVFNEITCPIRSE